MNRLLRSCSLLGTVALVVCTGLIAWPGSAALAQTQVVLFDGELGAIVGGCLNGKWEPADKAAKRLNGGETWTLYSGEKESTGTGTAPKQMDTPFEHAYELEISPKPKSEDYLATTGLVKAILAPARAGSTTIPAYVEAAKAFLTAAGLKNPEVKITQLIKVDLDRDGEDETIVVATRYARANEHGPSPNADAGDYSVVFVRKLVDGKVKTIPLFEDVYPKAAEFSAPYEHKFAGALDLNGDGVMEIVIRSNYYEGSGTTVFEIKKAKAKDVLSEELGV